MSHQFLHDLEFNSQASKKCAVCMPESVPPDPLVDTDSFSDRTNEIVED
jgi:hypothetical protein